MNRKGILRSVYRVNKVRVYPLFETGTTLTVKSSCTGFINLLLTMGSVPLVFILLENKLKVLYSIFNPSILKEQKC